MGIDYSRIAEISESYLNNKGNLTKCARQVGITRKELVSWIRNNEELNDALSAVDDELFDNVVEQTYNRAMEGSITSINAYRSLVNKSGGSGIQSDDAQQDTMVREGRMKRRYTRKGKNGARKKDSF